MGWLQASNTLKVPKSTLSRRVENKNKVLQGSKVGYLGGSMPVFSKDIEGQLVDHIKTLEVRFFGLSSRDLRKLAYQLATKLKLKHKFNQETKMAGWDWLQGFLKRNPSISVRTPEATSLARAQAFNKVQIAAYFERLEQVLDEFKFSPAQIYNVDESGLSTVQSKMEKNLATKGRKQVGTLTAAQRGLHFTLV
ncbi:uncharacterized protein LOC115887611 [Sitophilus oryzae]|uniref:Uncharacterized protein LOC115887611 n=1 Tax=Sitophilus oryzae TaxID=7048 RepID=A0A6J2YHP0_SITOR|nr:uncharacterized protein LOC115887611 [Sitophilus oryzae]